MRSPPTWRRYLRFWGPNVEGDVDDELAFHVEMRVRDYIARGLTPDEARRAALERIGDVERLGGTLRDHDRRRERVRQRRELMNDLMQDLRYAIRMLRHAPVFTTVAALTLALGIGATTAIFSVVNAVILRPLAFPDPGRLVMVWMDNRRMGMNEDIHSWPNFLDYREQNRTFEELAGYAEAGYNLTGGCIEGECEPQRVAAAVTTATFFRVLAVAPQLGRTYTAEEEQDGRDAVVVISHALWSRLGGDPALVGRTVRMNGRERTVIGVMPKGFAFPSKEQELWVPLVIDAAQPPSRQGYFLWVVGRLKKDASLERARAEMATIARRLEERYPENRDLGVNLVALPRQVVGPTLRTALWVLLGSVGAVLLIACANVANLMLSRAAVREREIGVRAAMGATRERILRQLLTESVLLAVLGGVLGIALAWAGLRALRSLAPADLPRIEEVGLDPVVLAVTFGVAVLTGILFGLVPALRASRADLVEALREGGRGSTAGRGQRVHRLLVAGQVALVVVLLAGAGLLIRSFLALQSVELGFQPDNLITMRVALPASKYQTPVARAEFHAALQERVAALPGVRGAGAISDIFLSKTPNSTTITVEGRERTADIADIEVPVDAVTPDYFRAMGITLVSGRTFNAQDRNDSPRVVIINQNMARRFWPNEDPVGKRFRYGDGAADSQAPWMTIVGVVGDMRRTGYDLPVRYETFLPYSQQARSQMTMIVRAASNPSRLANDLRQAVRAIDRDLPVYQVRSMDELLSDMIAQRRFSMALLGTFAALALLLGVVGVYGVTSYLVAQRTREVGLRLALGAEPGQLVGMVVRQGMRTALIGLGVGLIAALGATRLMAGLLFGVAPHDLVTLLAVGVLLAVATFAANWVPARRAARVDPLVALRSD